MLNKVNFGLNFVQAKKLAKTENPIVNSGLNQDTVQFTSSSSLKRSPKSLINEKSTEQEVKKALEYIKESSDDDKRKYRDRIHEFPKKHRFDVVMTIINDVSICVLSTIRLLPDDKKLALFKKVEEKHEDKSYLAYACLNELAKEDRMEAIRSIIDSTEETRRTIATKIPFLYEKDKLETIKLLVQYSESAVNKEVVAQMAKNLYPETLKEIFNAMNKGFKAQE